MTKYLTVSLQAANYFENYYLNVKPLQVLQKSPVPQKHQPR